MSTIYLNMRAYGYRETVDEFTRENGQSMREFRKYVNEMVAEYRMAGMPVYQSSRMCANWRE